MSDTNINQYYPEEVPQSLVAGEAPGTPAPQSNPEPSVPEMVATDAPQDIVSAGKGVVDLGIDLPDIPLPDDEPIEDGVKDTFDDAAFNFAIVGVGQGGSRLAESFWNLGYRRVGVINTAQQDLSSPTPFRVLSFVCGYWTRNNLGRMRIRPTGFGIFFFLW